MSRRHRILWLSFVFACAGVWCADIAYAQRPRRHYFQSADLPPGAVGQAQLLRGGPRAGYFQPVQVQAPEGALVSLAAEGGFLPPRVSTVTAGMLIGQVYRFKVSNIPLLEGEEVFPSIEVIDRLYPPPGHEHRFPIPIQVTRQEIELALRGNLVTRVIYLEDPRSALPRREDPSTQRYFDVGPRQDPLQAADQLGRPVAILRIGSRVPESVAADAAFLFHSPPLQVFPETAAPATQPADQAATVVAPARVPGGPEGTPQ